tara:strand:- start:322 stop:555 length:234 start_codon:yes stop_codon:yes gene_type:complete
MEGGGNPIHPRAREVFTGGRITGGKRTKGIGAVDLPAILARIGSDHEGLLTAQISTFSIWRQLEPYWICSETKQKRK